MASATLIDLIFIPMFFVLVSQVFRKRQATPPPQQQPLRPA
jgi:hypothetical protein